MSTARSKAEARTTYHHGDLRNALLDAGSAVARDVGSEALSLREVARRAGVSHTAAYNHFADNTDRLRGLAIRAFEQLATDLREVVDTGVLSLEDLGVAYLRFAATHQAEFRFMFQRSLCMPEGVPDPLGEASLASQNVLRDYLVTLQEAGLIGAGDPDSLTLAVWSQIHGLTTIVLDTPAFKSLPTDAAEELAREGISKLVTGIGARPASKIAARQTKSERRGEDRRG